MNGKRMTMSTSIDIYIFDDYAWEKARSQKSTTKHIMSLPLFLLPILVRYAFDTKYINSRVLCVWKMNPRDGRWFANQNGVVFGVSKCHGANIQRKLFSKSLIDSMLLFNGWSIENVLWFALHLIWQHMKKMYTATEYFSPSQWIMRWKSLWYGHKCGAIEIKCNLLN